MQERFSSELSRRHCLKISLASLLGVSYSGWLPALARQSYLRQPRRSCILLWMNGGPSQLDTFDLKPGTSTGGPFRAIPTAVPGVHISEHLPGLARHTDRIAIIRSMTSKEGDHGRATYLTRTGYRPLGPVRYPTLGAVVSKELGVSDAKLPNYVSVSPFRFFNEAAYGPGFLGPAYAPLTVAAQSGLRPERDEKLKVEDLHPPEHIGSARIRDRVDLLGFVQSEFRKRHRSAATEIHRANYERAVRMVMSSEVGEVFDLSDEPAPLVERYGRNRFGQGCLLARRLVERGVPFVEVALSSIPGASIGWDTHLDNFNSVTRLSQVLDPAWSTLMDDLKSRGLLDSTLIVWMGEFGRTPTINGFTGRDHWPTCWTAVLAGGGIQGGRVIGDTGKRGLGIEDRPVTVPELMSTICAAVGIDPAGQNIIDDRPIGFVDEHAKPVTEALV